VRVVFLGNAPWAVPALEALARSTHRLVRVVTRVPRPAGRGSVLTPTPPSDAARRLQVPLEEVQSVKSGPGFDVVAAEPFDVLAVVAYGEILPSAVLGLPRVAPVNLHFSLLPQLRGAAPVQRAILEGLAVTGVTTIRMDEGMDTGAILLQAPESIDPADDAGSLGARLAANGARVLVDTLDRLEAGSLHDRPQDEEKATRAPRIRPEERVIDWQAGAERVVRQVRALAPEPGAITTFRGRNLKVLRASFRSGDLPAGPIPPVGTLFGVSSGGSAQTAGVSTGDLRVVVLERVAPEGRKHMTGEEFLRGFPPRQGEVLGG
jgi:methionyl-tRNA formyltransferase